ncbi:MAG: D-tyrosyl-tRNA(Tyr) deacylase [Betaproteobacteria bacterium]|nr:D-tyrosyl-tRNA(Tyr) deacylase [Betaproteobacteria bacterium]
MIGLLQRVTRAKVEVEGTLVGEIGPGLCVFVCGEPGDTEASAERLLDRLLGYRVFADQAGKMNLSLGTTGGGLLLVPQFTLAADTGKGMRASFSSALSPEPARGLFDYLLARARERHRAVAAGRFAAYMQVSLTNDGPVTFWLRVDPGSA